VKPDVAKDPNDSAKALVVMKPKLDGLHMLQAG
jgi:hypothetical protein